MCGRFALTPEATRGWFGYADAAEFPPRDPILPEEPIALVVAEPFTGGAARRLMLARWGLLPAFVKEPYPLLVNARAEGVLDRPSFAPAFRRRRCLVPASAFYVAGKRGLARVEAADGGPLALAGLYETFLHRSGSEMDTACLVTVAADALLAPLNPRMPALIPQAAFAAWLDHERTSLDTALDLLHSPARLRWEPAGDTFR